LQKNNNAATVLCELSDLKLQTCTPHKSLEVSFFVSCVLSYICFPHTTCMNHTLTTSTSQLYLLNARLSHRDNHVYERKRNGCPVWSRRALQPTSWKANVPKGGQRKQRALSKMRGFQPAQALVGSLDCECHSPSRWSLCQKTKGLVGRDCTQRGMREDVPSAPGLFRTI
jgi:hypothetical protein